MAMTLGDPPFGGLGQCAGSGSAYGRQYAALGEWTPYVRHDEDRRPGGCNQGWAIIDPKNVVGESTFLISHYPDGDAGQCGSRVDRQPILRVPRIPGDESQFEYSPAIRVDTDNRSGGCQFRIEQTAGFDYAMEMQFWPDGDAGQCQGQLAAPPNTVVTGQNKSIEIRHDEDDRSGGCRQAFRIIKVAK